MGMLHLDLDPLSLIISSIGLMPNHNQNSNIYLKIEIKRKVNF